MTDSGNLAETPKSRQLFFEEQFENAYTAHTALINRYIKKGEYVLAWQKYAGNLLIRQADGWFSLVKDITGERQDYAPTKEERELIRQYLNKILFFKTDPSSNPTLKGQ
jgi:hypothetical protein